MDEDPRVYFAAERTLLAWLRTGIAVIGLGFLVARFGLFLAVLRASQHVPQSITGSTVIGTAFVVIGACLIAVAVWQHRRFSRTLSPLQRPAAYSVQASLWMGGLLAVLSTLLAGYLLLNMFSGV